MEESMKSPNRAWRAVAVLCALSAVPGCASGPAIYSKEAPLTHFDRYRTFAFEEHLGTDGQGGERSILSSYLVDAARSEMEQRGYVYQESKPDLTLNFYLNTEEKTAATTMPGSGFGYYGYRTGYYGTWGGYETTVTQYTEGTLQIDLVESERDQLVWEGTAVGQVHQRDSEKIAELVPAVVTKIMAKFPHTAPPG
jgi:hypothetical protein